MVYKVLLCAQAGGSGSSKGDSLQDHLQRESLERYLTSRIQGVGPGRAKQLLELHGVAIVQQLDGDAEAAIKALVQIRGVGRKTAEQMLSSWARNSKKGGSLISSRSLLSRKDLPEMSGLNCKTAKLYWRSTTSDVGSGSIFKGVRAAVRQMTRVACLPVNLCDSPI